VSRRGVRNIGRGLWRQEGLNSVVYRGPVRRRATQARTKDWPSPFAKDKDAEGRPARDKALPPADIGRSRKKARTHPWMNQTPEDGPPPWRKTTSHRQQRMLRLPRRDLYAEHGVDAGAGSLDGRVSAFQSGKRRLLGIWLWRRRLLSRRLLHGALACGGR